MESPVVYFKDLFSGRPRIKKAGDPSVSDITSRQRPFGVMVRKEVADHIRSWRFIVLLILIVLTFVGAMYVSLSNLKAAVSNENDPDRLFLYLKLLTATDGSLPPFHIFMSFLGALLGISLGFDAINAERNNGTLIRLLAQPVYRDNLLLAKFLSALVIVAVLFLSLSLLMIGGGLIITGVRIEGAEFFRILAFVILTVLYVGFWLSLAILLSVKFRQATTSALTAIGIWLFFTIFYRIVVNMIVRSVFPDPNFMTQGDIVFYNNVILDLLRLAPSQLYTDATTTLLMPSVRSLGPLTMEQMAGAIPSPLSVRESILIVWPQVSGLLAATAVCFALAYFWFMRREIRT
ncbi:ABC transporter permease [Chitinophaga ginsengisoli]|uniref:ABC-2 type transport system permease protein n=1 Tax=Chitinophaga ginsengisoli TaxID=363837 RepID=A0A2P8G2M2_9BACT|nr:ABC transporter permease subunit [Chitinophaga ginsengisoli]PSL28223.1 ABC-2 type transport system permease protein [Chitinophaga ginsengisoli]